MRFQLTNRWAHMPTRIKVYLYFFWKNRILIWILWYRALIKKIHIFCHLPDKHRTCWMSIIFRALNEMNGWTWSAGGSRRSGLVICIKYVSIYLIVFKNCLYRYTMRCGGTAFYLWASSYFLSSQFFSDSGRFANSSARGHGVLLRLSTWAWQDNYSSQIH